MKKLLTALLLFIGSFGVQAQTQICDSTSNFTACFMRCHVSSTIDSLPPMPMKMYAYSQNDNLSNGTNGSVTIQFEIYTLITHAVVFQGSIQINGQDYTNWAGTGKSAYLAVQTALISQGIFINFY